MADESLDSRPERVWLRSDVVLQQDDTRLFLLSEESEIEVRLQAHELDGGAVESLWAATTTCGSTRADWLQLDLNLRNKLEGTGLVESAKPTARTILQSGTTPLDCVALTEVVGNLAEFGRTFSNHALIVVPTEVLYLPARLPANVVQRAFRMFLSGMSDHRLRCICAKAVTKNLRTAGGLSARFDFEAALKTIDEHAPQHPVAFAIDVNGFLVERTERLSVVQSMTFGQLNTGDDELVSATATYAIPNLHFVGVDDDKTFGFGVGPDRSSAETIARSEALERFAAGDVRANTVVVTTGSELRAANEEFVEPPLLMRYNADQHERHKNLRQWSENEPTAWVIGRRIRDESRVYVPAELVHYPFHHETVAEYGHFGWATSSGMAAHPSIDEAIRRATYELIERHGFMSLWLRHQSGRQLEPPRRSEAGELLSYLRGDGVEVVLHDVANHGVPAVVAAARTPSHNLALGAAAGRLQDACCKALIEAATSLSRWRFRDRPSITATEVRRPEDHEALYLSAEAPLWASEFLFRMEEVVALPNTWEHDLADIVPDHLVACDLTSELTVPLRIVRCIGAGFVPITFGYDMEPLGLWRAEVPGDLRLSESDGALVPHPFA